MKAWHFVNDTLRDGSPIPKDGKWLKHEGECVMCKSGLHASKRITDALSYAPGKTICRVKLRGVVDKHSDKVVAQERKILWRIDGEAVLRTFACKQALSVGHYWTMPNIVREYLETQDESKWYDARAAVSAAVRDAARDAARAAVSAAVLAECAALDAARAAVSAAVRDDCAALDAVSAAVLAEYAALDAARAAASAAVLDNANRMLEDMVRHERDRK